MKSILASKVQVLVFCMNIKKSEYIFKNPFKAFVLFLSSISHSLCRMTGRLRSGAGLRHFGWPLLSRWQVYQFIRVFQALAVSLSGDPTIQVLTYCRGHGPFRNSSSFSFQSLCRCHHHEVPSQYHVHPGCLPDLMEYQ